MNEAPAMPSTVVIFGASGDLAHRKLVPALFSLCRKRRLPAKTKIVGYARRDWSQGIFRSRMEDAVREFSGADPEPAAWNHFARRLHYVSGGFDKVEDYRSLREQLRRLETEDSNRVYYLATPPDFFESIISHLGELGMVSEEKSWRRVVIEKPFGTDLDSAQALNRSIHRFLAERQVYRIDHYLAKETVQNILVFRFGNSIFEPLWNRNNIDSVQITAAEVVDVGHRAGYYDQVGILRDMFQNHLLQLLALVGMEPPASFEADALRNEKVKVLSSVRPIRTPELSRLTVRGQYKGYRASPGVASDSQTATYAALCLHIDNWRWQGVPFFLRSGKALPHKTTEVNIQFKAPPHMMFPLPETYRIRANRLSLCIQPHEGMHLRFEVKVPDTAAEMRSTNMNFHYEEEFGRGAIPEAYERLLLNALEGDAALFTRSDGIEAAWGLVDPIIRGWDSGAGPPLETYEPGSWGPAAADALVQSRGKEWILGCCDH